jgi:hypothetical protein
LQRKPQIPEFDPRQGPAIPETMSAEMAPDPAQPLFTLDSMQFFGRVASDYEAMFAIRLQDLRGLRVMDCPSGPGSFVSEARSAGVHATGVDPLYEKPLQELLARGRGDVAHTIERMRANAAHFADIDLDAYARSKLLALERFAVDFPTGVATGRYVAASLPALPFPDRDFDLTLSAHLLFTYSDPATGGLLPKSPFTLEWHLAAVDELLRVTRNEVRLYPTTTRSLKPARHPFAETIAERCRSSGMHVEFESSSFARGNHAQDTLNACLVLRR